MQAVRETTQWADGNTGINHTYLLDGDRMLAYIRQGTSEPFWFKNPIRIDRRGRRFESVPDTQFNVSVNVFTPVSTKEVQGSKGQTYIVDLDAKTCTCPGFTFRGSCKHVQSIETAA